MISFAQATEDVLLDRALRHVDPAHGFYIDVGAFHPTFDSVTAHFYKLGWRGINIEPSRTYFPAFPELRPRDVNLQVAVADQAGERTFYEVGGQLGTLEAPIAKRHVESGQLTHEYQVPVQTLADICANHVRGPIHFLKIDIEGGEAAAIRGADFVRFRPWILIIESVEPCNLDASTFEAWEADILRADYKFVFTDVLNRYYVSKEHAELVTHFSVPPDDYKLSLDLSETMYWRDRAKRAEDRLAQLGQA